MTEEDVRFLKDQVQRLNSVLLKYQKQHGVSIDGENIPDEPSLPWLAERSVLSPLLLEYDQHIKEVEQENLQHQNNLSSLQKQISKLVAENDRLASELKKSVETNLDALHIDDQHLTGGEDEALLLNLQEQLQTAVQEKNEAYEMFHAAEEEILRLERELHNEKDSHQWKVVKTQAQHVHDQYDRAVTSLNTEMEKLTISLKEARTEIGAKDLQIRDLKLNLEELRQQIRWKDQETSEVLMKEGITDCKLSDLKSTAEDYRQRFNYATKDNEELKRQNSLLEARVTELQNKIGSAENKEVDAVRQIHDAIVIVQNATLEKEQAEEEMHMKGKELEILQDVVNTLINEAGMRTREEVDVVKQQCNNRITKLTEEVHILEMDNMDKQSNLERCLREKRAAESELDKLHKDMVALGNKDKEAYEDMSKRAITAERLKDEAEMQIETLQCTMRREELNSQQMKSQLETRIQQITDRCSIIEQQFENVNDEKVLLVTELDDLKKKLQNAVQEKEMTLRKYEKESSILQSDIEMKIRDQETKLQASEDVNRQGMSELRKLLTAQQRMSARWKEECHTITQKFELKVNDLRAEISHLKKRNDEITSLLRESQERTMEAEKMISDYTRNIRRMEDRVRESEARAAVSSKDLSRYKIRERQMLNERQSLLTEIDNSRLQSSHGIKDSLLDGEFKSSIKKTTVHFTNGNENGFTDT